MVHDAKHRRLKHLRLDDRTFDGDDRLFRKRYLALPHGIDVARELHRGEIFAHFFIFIAWQELLEEALIGFSEAFHHLQHLAHATDDRPVVGIRSLAVEEVENSAFVLHPIVVERLAHRILILVGAIRSVQFHDKSQFFCKGMTFFYINHGLHGFSRIFLFYLCHFDRPKGVEKSSNNVNN